MVGSIAVFWCKKQETTGLFSYEKSSSISGGASDFALSQAVIPLPARSRVGTHPVITVLHCGTGNISRQLKDYIRYFKEHNYTNVTSSHFRKLWLNKFFFSRRTNPLLETIELRRILSQKKSGSGYSICLRHKRWCALCFKNRLV